MELRHHSIHRNGTCVEVKESFDFFEVVNKINPTQSKTLKQETNPLFFRKARYDSGSNIMILVQTL
jgi:hypothetical protein